MFYIACFFFIGGTKPTSIFHRTARRLRPYTPMRPQSAKAKGRRNQQKIVADLYEVFPQLGEGDLRSTGMGQPGEDIQMSAAARRLIPFSFESKNQERVNVWEAYAQCKANCGAYAPAVVIKKNHSDMLCVIQWKTFLDLLKASSGMEYGSNVDGGTEGSQSVPHKLRAIADELEAAAVRDAVRDAVRNDDANMVDDENADHMLALK